VGVLQRYGALNNPDLKALIDLKLEEAKKYTRASAWPAALPLGPYKPKPVELVSVCGNLSSRQNPGSWNLRRAFFLTMLGGP
jgi:hypothetical protein